MAEDHWVGWLIDNIGDRKDEVVDQLKEAIDKRNIPMYGNRDKTGNVEVKIGKDNMWWRNEHAATFGYVGDGWDSESVHCGSGLRYESVGSGHAEKRGS